jgi:hypothetical protein
MGSLGDRARRWWQGRPRTPAASDADAGLEPADDELHDRVAELLARELGVAEPAADLPSDVTPARIAAWMTQNQFSYGVQAQQTLFSFALGRSIHTAGKLVRSQDAANRRSVQELELATLDAFYGVVIAEANLRVIEAEVMPLSDLANEPTRSNAAESPLPAVAEVGGTTPAATGVPAAAPPATPDTSKPEATGTIRTKKDLERYERIFADAAFWKKVGAEYENPLIITGTMWFQPQQTAGWVNQNREQYDQLGRRVVVHHRRVLQLI